MAERMLLAALKTQPKHLNLSCKNLIAVPAIIGSVASLECVVLKDNKLRALPKEFSYLKKLVTLNLGCNKLEELPSVLLFLSNLSVLHVFRNQLIQVDGNILTGLSSLTLLNLNDNQLQHFPKEISCLKNLQSISIDNNCLSELPSEICFLQNLEALHVASNKLERLPENFGLLRRLNKLHVQKNQLSSLPESLCRCSELKILDVSANRINIFPAELLKMRLKELYCEQNNLLQHLPVHSIQEEEVLTLKEICVRLVVSALKDSTSNMRHDIKNFPEAEKICENAASCVVCSGPFLDTWLECVQFVDSRKVLRTKTNAGILPVRGLLCSYKCFNASSHDFYGVGVVDNNS